MTENGALRFGAVHNYGEGDPDIINASGQPVEVQSGTSFFDHAESFAMTRGGFIDIAVLGGLQVSEKGDLANWLIPERKLGGIGGAMDLAFSAKRVIVVMNHVAKDGRYKIVKECTYPLTAARSVDLIVTDIAVVEVTSHGLVLKEVAPGWSPEEVQCLTEPRLIVAAGCHDIGLL